MRAPSVGSSIAVIAVLLALLSTACSDSHSGPSPRTFKAGAHTCTEAEPGPPPTCESSAPGPCGAPATACWVLGITALGGYDAGAPIGPQVAALCPGCCNGNNAGAQADTCIGIVCSTASDCPIESSGCTGGYCQGL